MNEPIAPVPGESARESGHGDNPAGERPPRPIVKRMRWPFPIIWIVPIAAAVLAGYFLYQHHKERGTEVAIELDDVAGITADQTLVQMHGVPVGRVKSIELSSDHQHGVVHVRLNTSDEFLARQETIFWVVRPELSLESVSGLNALVTGPYIEVRPGGGDHADKFHGLSAAPIIDRPGMKVVLHADQLGEVTASSPVTYRGIKVGVVQDIRLGDLAESANVTIYVWEPYTVLVRSTSAFWMVKGADIKGGLFSGVRVKFDSLRTLLTGGITFSTPEKDLGKPVTPNAQFFLNETPKDEWLKWNPKIRIATESKPAPAESGSHNAPRPLPAPQQGKPKEKH